MNAKTEAERRLALYWQSVTLAGRTQEHFEEMLVLFRSIFDPLPEEQPDSTKSLGQVAFEGELGGLGLTPWSKLETQARAMWEGSARAVIAAHEARRPKPTVEEVAQLFSACGRAHEGNYADYARRVFPLFGVTP